MWCWRIVYLCKLWSSFKLFEITFNWYSNWFNGKLPYHSSTVLMSWKWIVFISRTDPFELLVLYGYAQVCYSRAFLGGSATIRIISIALLSQRAIWSESTSREGLLYLSLDRFLCLPIIMMCYVLDRCPTHMQCLLNIWVRILSILKKIGWLVKCVPDMQ